MTTGSQRLYGRVRREASETRFSDLELIRRLLLQARPYWAHITGIFLLALLATPLGLLGPVPLKIAVDSVIGSDALPAFLEPLVPSGLAQTKIGLLAFAAGLVVVIALVSRLQKLGDVLLRTYAGERLVLGLRARLFNHAQQLSLSYHDSKGTSDALYRIQYDTSCIQRIAVNGLIPFVKAVVTFAAMLYVAARLDWQLALVALGVSPVLILLTTLFRGRLRRQWKEVKRIESSALGVVQEVLTSLRVVKAFGQESREEDRFFGQYMEGVRERLRVVATEGTYGLLIGLTTAIGTGAVLFLGVYHVLEGILTLGSLLLVMSYINQMYGPLFTLGKQVTALQKALAAAERVFSFLQTKPDVTELQHAVPVKRASGSLVFEDVGFEYEPGEPVLSLLTLEVPAGTRVGIAGRTGVGKTTLVGLLMRFFDPVEGRILLDGVDLRDYRLADLRNQYAIVLQDTILFSTSIAENIAYARPDATAAEIEAAADAADAHDFVSNLPDGYATLVGERGMRLSGGERQRVALARAFLKDAPILILDEPTSAVDQSTEASIMEAMQRLMAGRTVFMISHRLSALDDCDLLLVLEAGRPPVATDNVSWALGQLGELRKEA